MVFEKAASGITPLTPQQVQMQEANAAKEEYLKRCLIGFDMLTNLLTDGDPDETISSRAARAAERGKAWGVAMSKFLDLFQRDHGAKAQAGDLERAKLIAALDAAPGATAAVGATAASGESSGS